MGGFELARRVKEIKPDLPISLMTAFETNSSEFEKVCRSAKIDGFIRMPGKAKSVCAAIEGILG